jgi:hypothetical protein
LRKAKGLPMLPLPVVQEYKEAPPPSSQIIVEWGGAQDGETEEE